MSDCAFWFIIAGVVAAEIGIRIYIPILAARRGRPGCLWFLIGLPFGLLALLALLMTSSPVPVSTRRLHHRRGRCSISS